MTNTRIIPAAIVGFLAGVMVARFISDPSVTAATFVSPITTIFAAWWIQRSIRRQGELDKIPIESVAGLCKRVDDLITKSVDKPADTIGIDPDLLQTLALLSNELIWIRSIADVLGVKASHHEELFRDFFKLKTALTGEAKADLMKAEGIARLMRTRMLALQGHISGKILASPDSVHQLVIASNPDVSQ